MIKTAVTKRRKAGGGPPPVPGAMKIGINQSGLGGYPDYAHTLTEKFVGYAAGGYGYTDGFFGANQGEVPEANLTDGWVSSLPIPSAYIRHIFVCDPGTQYTITWEGDFAAGVDWGDHFVSNATENSWNSATRVGTFTTAVGTAPVIVLFVYHFTSTINYPKNIRVEKVGGPAQTFEPKYLSLINNFNGTLRFTKWFVATVEANFGSGVTFTKFGGGTASSPNYPITWAKRRKPTDGMWGGSVPDGRDGTPIEIVVACGNAFAGDAIHLPVPSLADDDWHTNIATYVRDNLNPAKTIYIEVDNEVWNWGYDATWRMKAEAEDPAISALYSGGPDPTFLRYIHVTKRIADIWTAVFAGQTNRIKPMINFQHGNPSIASFAVPHAASQGWLANIKAYGTAPYITAVGFDDTYTGSMAPFFAALTNHIDGTLAPAAASHKAIADAQGLEFVTYEAGYGQRLNDLATLQTVKISPLMYDLYLHYLHTMAAYYTRMTLFTFSESLWVNDGIYGHVFPTVYEVNISKADTPAMQAVIDYIVGA